MIEIAMVYCHRERSHRIEFGHVHTIPVDIKYTEGKNYWTGSFRPTMPWNVYYTHTHAYHSRERERERGAEGEGEEERVMFTRIIHRVYRSHSKNAIPNNIFDGMGACMDTKLYIKTVWCASYIEASRRTQTRVHAAVWQCHACVCVCWLAFTCVSWPWFVSKAANTPSLFVNKASLEVPGQRACVRENTYMPGDSLISR